MDRARGFRGWLAAITVAVTLTLVFLAVEKHIRLPTPSFFKAAGSSDVRRSTTAHRGILLVVDPGLAGVEQYPPTDTTPIVRKSELPKSSSSANMLRRPPEPAASVVLQAPIATEPLTALALPLHGSSSKIDYLMDAMDKALETPMRTASVSRPQIASNFAINLDRLTALPSPASMSGRIPEPRRLMTELDMLEQRVTSSVRLGADRSLPTYLTSRAPNAPLSANEAQQVEQWVTEARLSLKRLIFSHGLEHAECARDLEELVKLADQATAIGNTLTDYGLARELIGTGYALQRRVQIWQAIHQCLDGTSIALTTPRNPETARQELHKAIQVVASKVQETGEAESWRKYLLLEELSAWASSPQDIWSEGSQLALNTLSRLHWQRLSESQRRFLSQPEFEELAAHLSVWGREPVDYRQLLTELETLEEDPISRVSTSLAGAVQVLRLSGEQTQKLVATRVNNHYRNANIRLSLSRELIERLLPEGEYEVRPVRHRILGADTAGDSAVKTELKISLIPDETAWNVGVGVQGDVVSSTRSAKGPAVFHNTSTAQIDSQRFVRLDPMGYRVSSVPTNVHSQDQLQKMSTDFDGLPIIGDFARFLVREQFDSKRGLAQRITRRIIAQEADAELDRRLEEHLADAEHSLQQRLVGPLERLNLNPMVVAMNTTEERLTIRYRVANESQMAAHTPRPRAPSDSLLSMQFHESAINNAIEQIGLCGRTWTLGELYEHLGQVFQQSDWVLPEDVPADITVRFADTRAATVEMDRDRLRLTLRIAELRQGDHLLIERFIVSSNYIPVADGLSAELIRDGVVEIVSNHDRLKLRVIFAKVFVSNPQIPLISESWATDPRAEGLAVSQLEIRDGWLAVALSNSDSQLAHEVASRARELQQLK